MNQALIKNLSGCRLFRDVSPKRVMALLESVGAREEIWEEGNLVRPQGFHYIDLIIVAEGSLEARIDDSTGRGLTVEHFRSPSAVATAVLVSSDPVLPVSLTALERSVLVTVAIEKVFELFALEPLILKAYLADAGDKVRFLAEKLRLIRFGSLRRKIAGHLLSLSRDQGTESPKWRYGRDQTADLLGAARPSLSRELSQMSREGFLEVVGRSEVRLSTVRLKSLLEED